MNEHRIHQVFVVSVLLKGAHALIEIVSGAVLALVSTGSIANLAEMVTREELIDDPNDFIANHILAWAQGFSMETKNFYAFYLLSHGIVKLGLVVGLMQRKLWAYPASLVIFSLFIVYQLYRYSYTHGFGLILITVLDIVVIVLIWHEYRVMRKYMARV
jgi:uncharacterized membrane protein